MTNIQILRIFLPATLCLSTLVNAQEIVTAGTTSYNKYNFTIPANVSQMLSVDLNTDGKLDMLAIHHDGILVYLQTTNGSFDFDNPSANINVNGTSMGWDIANFRHPGSAQPQPSLLAIIDGQSIVTWDFSDNAVSGPITVLDDLAAYLPKGSFRINFANDINNDGYLDFIVPGSGQLKLYLQDMSGGYQSGSQIQSTAFYNTRLSQPSRIEGSLGQYIRIPLMELRDVNSDGLNDLVSRSEERLDVFIGQQENGTQAYPAEPSYTLDIAAIQERLGEFSVDKIDFSNLTGMLAMTHQEILIDVDDDGIDDLLIREGGKVSLFSGTSDSMDFTQPKQVLRSSGNVLAAFVRDENGDELKDLWIIRIESISIGDAFLWLALSGSVEVEAFIYRNDGTQFARRPARKLILNIKFPSILKLMGTALSIQAEIEDSETIVRPSAFLNLDQSSYDDLVVLLDERIDIYMNAKEQEDDPDLTQEEIEEEVEQSILTFLDYSPDKDNYDINIKEIIDKLVFNKNNNLELVNGRQADFQLALSGSAEVGDIFPVELNQDGIDDLVVFLERGDTHITGVLFLSSEVEL